MWLLARTVLRNLIDEESMLGETKKSIQLALVYFQTLRGAGLPWLPIVNLTAVRIAIEEGANCPIR